MCDLLKDIYEDQLVHINYLMMKVAYLEAIQIELISVSKHDVIAELLDEAIKISSELTVDFQIQFKENFTETGAFENYLNINQEFSALIKWFENFQKNLTKNSKCNKKPKNGIQIIYITKIGQSSFLSFKTYQSLQDYITSN